MTTRGTKQLGARIRELREKQGMSLMDMAFELRTRHGRRVTPETIRYYEIVKPNVKDMDPMFVIEIADVLGVKLSEFEPSLLDKAEKMQELLAKTGSRCNSIAPAQRPQDFRFKTPLTETLTPKGASYPDDLHTGRAA
jgi:transcriptional regulator with XRE-family HTH domain